MINGFGIIPIILAVVTLAADLSMSIVKLVKKKMEKSNSILMTKVQVLLTFLMAPIAFPITDFTYEDCLKTGLTDTVMNHLPEFAIMALITLLVIAAIIIVLLVVLLACKEKLNNSDDENKKCCTCSTVLQVFFFIVYFVVAATFLVLGFFGSLNSLVTAVVTTFSGFVEIFKFALESCKTEDPAEDADMEAPLIN